MLASVTRPVSLVGFLARVNQQEDDSERTAEASSGIEGINHSLSSQVHGGGQSSTSASFVHSPVASSRQFTKAARPSSGSKKPLQHVASKPQHGVPNKSSVSQHNLQ
jgi:hypothetical protein